MCVWLSNMKDTPDRKNAQELLRLTVMKHKEDKQTMELEKMDEFDNFQ